MTRIVTPETPDEFERYFDLRWRILREPWQQPRGSEQDDREGESLHRMACDEADKVLGVARLHFNNDEEAQIRYMAVEAAFTGQGIGTALLKALEAEATTKGAKRITLNARAPVEEFYRRHGYRTVAAAPTLFDCIEHVRMEKNL